MDLVCFGCSSGKTATSAEVKEKSLWEGEREKGEIEREHKSTHSDCCLTLLASWGILLTKDGGHMQQRMEQSFC